MTKSFNPDFLIGIKCNKEVSEIVSDFRSEFESIINRWQGHSGQSKKYYFAFYRDKSFERGLSKFPYQLHVSARGKWEDTDKQKKHKAFARLVVDHFRNQGCFIDFDAYFSLDE